MEKLESENVPAILEILDDLRRQAVAGELLQLFTVIEDAGGFSANWSASEDRFGIAGFVIGSAMLRMGFAKTPDRSSDPD